jgi:hypothetical protein
MQKCYDIHPQPYISSEKWRRVLQPKDLIWRNRNTRIVLVIASMCWSSFNATYNPSYGGQHSSS